MPKPSRSILISPRSLRSSLSHCTIVRSRIVAHSIGATFTSGSRVMTMPPEWIPMWRGKPSMRRHSCSNSAPVSPPIGPRSGTARWSARACHRRRRSPGRRACRARARCCCPHRSRAAARPRPATRFASTGATPDRFRQRFAGVVLAHDLIDLTEREPERFADVANRRARAVGDHLGRHRGVMAAVAIVDVLEHFLAILMREIDVDVGNLVALFAQEALEEQVAGDRIDRGDAERVADRRVGGRTAALSEHAELGGLRARCPTRRESSPRDPCAR